MIPLKITVHRLKPAWMNLREFQGMVKRAMGEAAAFWARELRPLHFAPNAAQRYGYASRSARTLLKKREKAYAFDRQMKMARPLMKPPRPLVYFGDLERTVMSGSPGTYRIAAMARSRATGSKYLLRIPVPAAKPLPHPLNPKISSSGKGAGRGDLVVLAAEEVRMMKQVMMASLALQIQKARKTRETQVIA